MTFWAFQIGCARNVLHSRRCWSMFGSSEAIIFIRFHILSSDSSNINLERIISIKSCHRFIQKRWAIKKKMVLFFLSVCPLPPKIYIEEMKNVLTYRNNYLRKFELDFFFSSPFGFWSSLLWSDLAFLVINWYSKRCWFTKPKHHATHTNMPDCRLHRLYIVT